MLVHGAAGQAKQLRHLLRIEPCHRGPWLLDAPVREGRDDPFRDRVAQAIGELIDQSRIELGSLGVRH
jgi:hypothetical protein